MGQRDKNEQLGPLPCLTMMTYEDLMFMKRASWAPEQLNTNNSKMVNMGMFSAVG